MTEIPFVIEENPTFTSGVNQLPPTTSRSAPGGGQASLLSAARQGTLPTAQASFSAWVKIGGKEYAAVGVEVSHSKAESRAVCDLAVGTNTRDLKGRPAIPANYKFIRGTTAQVIVQVYQDLGSSPTPDDTRAGKTLLLKEGVHTLFDGVVEDGGPSDLEHGRFNIRVTLVSQLAYLSSGSLQFAGLPSGFLGGGIINLGGTGSAVVLDPSTVSTDFWGGIQRTLINVIKSPEKAFANVTALNAFLKAFGSTQAKANAIVLGSITGYLPPGVMSATLMGQAVLRYLTEEFKININAPTIFQRIKALAEDFHFAVVENGLGIAAVPYTPFLPRSAIKTLIWPDTVFNARWQANSTITVNGLAFIDNSLGTLGMPQKGSQGSSQYAVYGQYVRPAAASSSVRSPLDPEGNGLGMVLPLNAPAWLTARNLPSSASQLNVKLQANQAASQLRPFGDPYARELALRHTYLAKSLTVNCPFRMDIGVCTPVRFVYPDVEGTGLAQAAAIYGAVERVTIVLDASSKRAATILEIMYARSEQQQIQDCDPGPFVADPVTGAKPFNYLHPIWATAYTGRRLDEHPGTGVTATEA